MPEITSYKRAEVTSRDGRRGQPVWIIIRDSVYDVTTFLQQHPGGADAIVGEAGGDATKEFDGVGHSSDAKTVLAKYKIGEIVEEEKRYDANGKKRKVVVASSQPSGKLEGGGARSCMSLISCGLLA